MTIHSEFNACMHREYCINLEKHYVYYKAAALKIMPRFIPDRIRVLKDKFGDFPFRGAGVAAGEHDCMVNKWGAVSVTARDGKRLGLKLDEFEPISFRENPAYAQEIAESAS
ncbi:hypothetical protein F6R98_10290 [Candidatus Methylospira mobilis]|uniref:Uncharacterized protein n=1 Tax=Candidatus Methylospira mobilis TaxID=1808979 RepID=A0A5Q0BGJ8_9GAMM|nr:hypothetical protein [Candidatus Methylospira mobilis]QFY42953.1 hypothetical protein F6R98_10290 [Candidatus Methylospira mobilis]